jgi:glucose/arabinose dehydrogenase
MSILRILPRLSLRLRIPAAFCILLLPSLTARAADPPAKPAPQHPVLTGQDAFTDALHESPGIRRHLTVADLPAPAPEQSVDNGPTLVPRPTNAWPIAPKGFKVELYATGLDNPRLIRTAPNGDLFLAESETGKIKVFRGVGADGKAGQVSVFATGLHQPFGSAFHRRTDRCQPPQWRWTSMGRRQRCEPLHVESADDRNVWSRTGRKHGHFPASIEVKRRTK